MLMHVMAGDKLEIATDAYYDNGYTPPNAVDATSMLNSIINAFQSSIDPHNPEAGQAMGVVKSAFSDQNFLEIYQDIKNQNTNPDLPRAYLNYLVYDEGMHLVPHQSGVIQVNTPDWHILQVPELTIDQGGYISVFITNETMGKPVAFDNVWVKVTKGVLLEENHYYPFGQVIRGSVDPTTLANKYLYQGKDLNEAATGNENDILNWYDFGARQYDPQLGRFTSLDPMAQFASGYVGMGNNPVSGVDPSGMWVSEGALSYVPGTTYNQWGGSESSYLDHRIAWWVSQEDRDKMSMLRGFKNNNSIMDTYAGDQTVVDLGGVLFRGHMASMLVDADKQMNKTEAVLKNYNKYNENKAFEKMLSEAKSAHIAAMTVYFASKLKEIEEAENSPGPLMASMGDGPGDVKEKKQETNWYGPGGRGNWLLGSFGVTLEQSFSSTYRWTSKAYGISPWVYPGGTAVTTNFTQRTVSSLGKGIGIAGGGLGLLMDSYGMYIWFKNPSSDNAVHPAKATLNTGMSAYGIWVAGPVGLLYFGVDSFHPGGWPGFIEAMGKMNLDLQKSYGPGFRLVPHGPK